MVVSIVTGTHRSVNILPALKDAPYILNWIASEMIHKRRSGPVEIGFFNEVGALVVRTRR